MRNDALITASTLTKGKKNKNGNFRNFRVMSSFVVVPFDLTLFFRTLWGEIGRPGLEFHGLEA